MRIAKISITAVLAAAAAMGQATEATYVPGVTYQTDNPNYFVRNPFYFEGRIDWNLLKITTPKDTWEFAQRGIHYQDDLEDHAAAIADYRTSLSMNSLSNGTCQILKAAPQGFGTTTNPPPCMFTVRLRLANLIKEDSPLEAIDLFKEVAAIDPLRLGVNGYIAETYEILAEHAADEASKDAALEHALEYFEAELELAPVTPTYTALTGDKANNAHVHWAMAEIYRELGDKADEAEHLNLYLEASEWHSDTYPWRITLAKARMTKLARSVTQERVRPRLRRR